ncbi:uncharacterized protein JN550_003017 [Neoarthrinium moseri]|uniref:uncharacterized protein n=1 Tax=Neoarthrinium moseri TaxID=1658444 RepID=UPI001FDCD39E|nr:uncharacterized protein JN550_003017 [Neoarthrinium moseri]KAI1873748.1 hypothetical protein JN550_003017 [Neoarthrinium moseri]
MTTSGFPPREPGGATPSIYIESSNHFSNRPRPFASGFSPGSIPMGIPKRPQREDEIAPPPLPPPRFIGEPPSFANHNRDYSQGSTSSYGSLDHSPKADRPGHGRYGTSKTMRLDRDEGYHSFEPSLPKQPQAKLMSHDQLYRPTGNDYDSSMLKRFDAKRTLENRPTLSSSANDVLSRGGVTESRQLPSLSLPIRSTSNLFVDSPGHLTDTPTHSAISPINPPFYGMGSSDYRSPIDATDPDRSPPFRSKRTNSGSMADDITVSTQGSYDNNADEMDFTMEDAGMGRLHLEEGSIRSEYQTIGQKRRASSPPGDELPLQGLPGASELLRRREGASRASPQPRLTIPQSSFSSISSNGRGGSYAPSLPMTAASGTSIASSFGRRSPGGLSPGGLSPVDSPFNTPISLTQSPRSSVMRTPHQRQVSDSRPLASPRKLTELPKASISRIQGFYMCECCPKKPKKFETAEELNAHAAEKQYECSFCGNRFKNKNEAERHQNSLHVRRHSWSCSALHVAGYDKAFHDSSNRPGEADACGYCGEEFLRSGGAGRARHATEQDWDDRLRHLQEVHKFRECNSSKKFYRADHFRQHLKHSHAGTSGKWTNMLETACMIEEEPPQPR